MNARMKPYRTGPDHEGTWLEVHECGEDGHGYVNAVGEHGRAAAVCVAPAEIPGLTAALYRAAGQEVSVDELAAFVHEAHCQDDCPIGPGVKDRKIAEALIAAGRILPAASS